VCPRCIAGCYFYSQENRLIDMTNFRLCYNLNKHTSDYESIFRLRPASWVVAVIGPPVRMNIYGIVNLHQGVHAYLPRHYVTRTKDKAGCRTGPAQRRPAARSQWLAIIQSGSTTLGRQLSQTGSYSATAVQCQRYGPLVRHRYSAQRRSNTTPCC
jgi:hypothetical protein